jgi:hypothetical protein
MKNLRNTKKPILYLLTIVLSVAIVCTQGAKLHVHNVDHQHDRLILAVDAMDHSHVNIAHLATDNSHADHHDGVVTENDANPEGMLIKVSSSLPALAIFAALFALLLLGVYRHTFHRIREHEANYFWRYYLSPPLRAPPL